MVSSLFVSLIFLSLLCFSSSIPHETIFDAADILSDSNYVSMALTLEVVSKTLLSQSTSLTIFAPSDSAFRKSGQPSLDLLRYHFTPVPLPLESLKLLPTGTKIPTMFSGNFLIVTSSASDGRISLNNVRISAAPIYDDGIFIIFGIERFLNPNSQFPATIPTPTHHFFCGVKNDTTVFFGDNSFNQARETLRSGGYTTMASFLGMQLSGIMGENVMTVFAPEDEAMVTRLGNFIEYPSIFLRHVVPCKLLWNDLVNFDDGTELPTYLEGFKIRITRSGGILMLNDVQVFFPDMYYSDKLVVHGVRQVFEEHGRPQEAEGTFPQMGGTVAQENVFNPGDL